MKKFLATLFAFAALSAQADVTVTKTVIGVEATQSNYNAINGNTNTQKTSGSGTGFLVELNKQHVVSLYNITVQTDSTASATWGSPSSWQEAAYAYKMPTSVGTFHVRAILNRHMGTGIRTLSHGEEVGVTLPLGSVFYGFAYRTTSPFDSQFASLKSQQVRNTVGYSFNKNHSVYVRHTRQHGYLDYQNLAVGYSYSF
jgi:hypothetical protein